MDRTGSPAIVLVVEDEPLIALDIEWIIERQKLAAITMSTLAEAMSAIADGLSPRAAILDVRLPDGDSFDLARRLVAGGTRVLFLTGYVHGVPPDLAACIVVQKPFTEKELKQALAGLLERGC